ncbi:MAG: hypothetical protein AAGB30_11225 [Pedobacter sp.]|nr:hypothetical protein [Pedobacter sp.]
MSAGAKYERYVSSRMNIEKIKKAFVIAHNEKFKGKDKGQVLSTPAQPLQAVV